MWSMQRGFFFCMENWVFTQKNKEIPSNITEKERLRLYKFHKNNRFFFFFYNFCAKGIVKFSKEC